ncbi:MAG TPA: hypothetical protein VKG25_18870 [Bryobacteraceae bacterium]|nr:hypothetical protein [Bryobacteraceae bacterium]
MITGMNLLRLAILLLAATCAYGGGRIVFLDIKGGRVIEANPDGSDMRVLVEGRKALPDGIVVDTVSRQMFWTNMGKPKDNDGSIERADLDGKHLTTVIPAGETWTPKQLKLDSAHGKLYWSDREGMRIMRANVDGSDIETLVETGQGDTARADPKNWCVGIAIDIEGGKIYWTQKGGSNAGEGSLRRTNLELPKGQTEVNRSDIEVLYDRLPEPIDIDLDLNKRQIYWTDRGDPPRGNTVNRAPMETAHRREPEILVSGLNEGIGIALDLAGGRMYFTDLGGSVFSAKLDGSDKKTLLSGQGALTGIAYFVLTP